MDTKRIESEASELAVRVAAFPAIQTDEEYEVAGGDLRTLAGMLRKIDETFDPIIQAAHRAHKEALNQKAKIADPVKSADRKLRLLIGDYSRKKEQARIEAERVAREEARKREEEKRLTEAVELERTGQVKEAEALIERPVVPIVAPAPVTPRPEGISTRTDWDFLVLDPSKLKPEYLIPDEVKIRKIVRAMGPAAEAMIGAGSIQIIEKTIVGARTA